MNYTIPTNATKKEVEAIIKHGMEAMLDTVEAGDDPDVSFLQQASKEAKVAEKQENASNKTDGNTGDNIANEDNKKELTKSRILTQ
jgi:hypothetical protein